MQRLKSTAGMVAETALATLFVAAMGAAIIATIVAAFRQ